MWKFSLQVFAETFLACHLKRCASIIHSLAGTRLTHAEQSTHNRWSSSFTDISPLTGTDTPKMASADKTTEGESNSDAVFGLPETKVCRSDNATVESCSSPAAPQMSKRAQKKMLIKQKLKEMRKQKRSPYTKNSTPGYDCAIFKETEYYFENGLRKVYPYHYTFSTYAKERWFGRTIQDVFENEFRVDSPDNFRDSVEKGHLRVNGKTVPLDYTLKNGDLIEHKIHRHENPVVGTPIEIIEDTPDLVVINKPASIPCHPCGRYRFNSIVFIMGKEFGYANLRNIYRLDRLTSGVLIMGKTARKTKELENQVLHRDVYKEYVARVMGEFPEGDVEVNQPLSPLMHKLGLWHVEKGGKPSCTSFQRLSFNGTTSVVKCIPHTGRTHQIRVHLQYLGHPIVNDPYYNSPAWGPLRGKGGHCDTSLEELCTRIMAEHNVGMWCDGENPLFHERLAELGETSQPAAKHSPDAASGVLDAEVASRLAEGAATPEPKRQRLSSQVDASQDIKSCSEAVQGDSAESKTNGKEQTVHRQCGFDAAKWVPNPTCESCRLCYIDPKPQDLLLYLHALRYKGPTWDFSTSLPDWACEDWKEPSDDKHCS